MRKHFLGLIAIVLFLLTSGCQAAQMPQPTVTLPPVPSDTPVLPTDTFVPLTPTANLEPALELIGFGGLKKPTLDEIKKLPFTEGQAGIKSNTGQITQPALYKGVALKDLVVVGGMDASMGENVEAKDGYSITYSYDQVTNGTFTAYDPSPGDELKSPDPLTVILAYERDGQPMPEESDDKLRLAIISTKNNQVTDGHWSVKWVTKLEVKSLGANGVCTWRAC
jgi:hypothetical protein